MSDSKTPVTHDLNTLFEKIKDVRMAMLTTFDEAHNLHSRPMATIKPEADGALLFFTDKESAKVYEVQKNSQVNLSYADPSANTYASVTGRASAYHDEAKIAELWSEPMRGWFPKGKEDPDVALLKVTVEQAEYWDAPSSKVVRVVGYAKAKLTGSTPDFGENRKVRVA